MKFAHNTWLFEDYAEFRKCLSKFSKKDWKKKVLLLDENFTWNNPVECMADHEE